MTKKEKTRKRSLSSSFIPDTLTINDFANAPVPVNRPKKASLCLPKQVGFATNETIALTDEHETVDNDDTTPVHLHLIFWMINTRKKGFNRRSTAKSTLCTFLKTLGLKTSENIIVDAKYLTAEHGDPRHPTVILDAKFTNPEIRDIVFNVVRSKKTQHGVHVSCAYEYYESRKRALLDAQMNGDETQEIDERFDNGDIPTNPNPTTLINLIFLGLEDSNFCYADATHAYNSICIYLASLGFAEPTNMIYSAYQVGPCDKGNPCPRIIKVKVRHSFGEKILAKARESPAAGGVRIVREEHNVDAFKTNRVLLQYLEKARQLQLRAILLTDQLEYGGKIYYCDNEGGNICDRDGQPPFFPNIKKSAKKKNFPPKDGHLRLLFSGIECICTEDGPSKTCARSSLFSFLSSILGVKSPGKMIKSAFHVKKPVGKYIRAKFLKLDDVIAIYKLVLDKGIPGISACYDAPVDNAVEIFLKPEEFKFYTTQQPAKLVIEKTVYVCGGNGNVVSNVDGSTCDPEQIAADVARNVSVDFATNETIAVTDEHETVENDDTVDNDDTTPIHLHLIFWMVINRKKGFTQRSTAKSRLCTFLKTLGMKTSENVIVDAKYLTAEHGDPRNPTVILDAKFANPEIRDVVFNVVRSKKTQHEVRVTSAYEYYESRKLLLDAEMNACCAENVARSVSGSRPDALPQREKSHMPKENRIRSDRFPSLTDIRQIVTGTATHNAPRKRSLKKRSHQNAPLKKCLLEKTQLVINTPF